MRALIGVYREHFGDMVMLVDGVDRRASGWEDWALITSVSAQDYSPLVWQVTACYISQLPGYDKLASLLPEQHEGCR